jgi:hypothetical protein
MATSFGGVLLRRHIAKACTETRWQCSAAKHTQQQAQDLIMQIMKPVQAADWDSRGLTDEQDAYRLEVDLMVQVGSEDHARVDHPN